MTPEEERDYQEALRRIKEAEKTGALDLDLSSLALKQGDARFVMLRACADAAGEPRLKAFCKVCGDLDVTVKKVETPALHNKRPAASAENLKVLVKPVYRETEILSYLGNGWHRQSRVTKVPTI
jgi:hypothetical protein